jgi:hypothetical protein
LRLRINFLTSCLRLPGIFSEDIDSEKSSRLLPLEEMKRLQRMAGAHFLKGLLHGGSGGLKTLLDWVRDLWSLFSNPGLGIIDEFVNLALAEKKLLA